MLEGNSTLNDVASQLTSYSKMIGAVSEEWEGYSSAASNFVSAAGAVGVTVNLPTINLDISSIVQSINTVVGSINEFVVNLQSTASVIGASLNDLDLNSDIKSGYASSKDPSSLTSLIAGSINKDSTIGGFSYVLADGTCIVWYGEDEYSDYGDFLLKVQEQAGEDFDLSNLKVLIKSKDTPIAWVDLDALNKDNSQDVSTPTGVKPTNESSVIDTTPNKDGSSSGSDQNNDEHLGSDENIGGDSTTETLTDEFVSFVPLNSGNATKDEVYKYLKTKTNFNDAAIAAIMGNIQQECSYNINSTYLESNGYTSHGLCQWNGGRYENLQNYCGDNISSVESQLDFMIHELETEYSTAYNALLNAENTADGARAAALTFASRYEVCDSGSYEIRQDYASDFFNDFNK